MGNSQNKYKKISNESKNKKCIKVILEYDNGIKQSLDYPDSNLWLESINDAIKINIIHGESFPSYKWNYYKK